MKVRTILSKIWHNIQYQLFPFLEKEIGILSDKHKKLVSVLEVIRIEDFIIPRGSWIGRPSKNRAILSRAFIAKCVFNFTYTNQLVDRLIHDRVLQRICGWEDSYEIPSEATFSRAFAEFSEGNLAEQAHRALITDLYKDEIIGHVCKDSTPIIGREKASRSEKKKQIRKRKTKREFHKLTRLERQASGQLTLEQMIEELPKHCDFGAKKTAGGTMHWKGYKLHIATDDSAIPLAAIVTSASVHDSQAGIPLVIKTKQRVENFYDLMDSAYSTEEILAHSRSLGHIPIIDFCPRTASKKLEKAAESKRRKLLNWKSAEDRRYAERMPKERTNALFKETCGGRMVKYKGIKKTTSQVMFNLLTITAILLLKTVQ